MYQQSGVMEQYNARAYNHSILLTALYVALIILCSYVYAYMDILWQGIHRDQYRRAKSVCDFYNVANTCQVGAIYSF